MYPEQVTACSGFLFLFFNRLAVLVEQLTCTFRRLTGDVFHRHALPEVILAVRRGKLLRNGKTGDHIFRILFTGDAGVGLQHAA